MLDADLLTCFANRRLAEMFGVTVEEMLGKPVLAFLFEQDVEPRREVLARRKRGVSEVFQVRYRRKDGSELWARVSTTPSFGADGTFGGVLAMVSDITEQRRAEAERRAALDRIALLSRAVEQTADSVLVADPDGIIEYVNPAFEVTTGYAWDDAVGQTPRILKSGQHDSAFYQALWEEILAGRPYRGTLVNRKKCGELYWASQTITPITGDDGRYRALRLGASGHHRRAPAARAGGERPPGPGCPAAVLQGGPVGAGPRHRRGGAPRRRDRRGLLRFHRGRRGPFLRRHRRRERTRTGSGAGHDDDAGLRALVRRDGTGRRPDPDPRQRHAGGRPRGESLRDDVAPEDRPGQQLAVICECRTRARVRVERAWRGRVRHGGDGPSHGSLPGLPVHQRERLAGAGGPHHDGDRRGDGGLLPRPTNRSAPREPSSA